MAFLTGTFLAAWPAFLLMAAMAAGVFGPARAGLALLGFAGLTAVMQGYVATAGAAVAIAGIAMAALLPRASSRFAPALHLVLILWCIAMAAHLVPGFHNPKVLDAVQAGPLSTPFTLHLNFDKPLVFFALLLACPPLLGQGGTTRWKPLAAGLGLLPALFALALAAGAIAPEPGLPGWWLVFALSNLFLTCIAEEAFFRGYLQQLISKRFGTPAALAAASLLFGLVHLPGGAALAVFAAILGLACGLGVIATGRLWVPVVMHFAFNTAHLALFTYPGAAG